jgi:hypothetical protein
MTGTIRVGGGQGTFSVAGEVKLDLVRYQAHIRTEVLRRLREIGERLKLQIQRNISASTRVLGPSLPGGFPHAETGRLRSSIYWEVDEARLAVRVGTPLAYGLYLEYGTGMGSNQGLFRYVDPRTGRWVYARHPGASGMMPRPFLRRTHLEMMPVIVGILSRPMPEMPRR